MNRAPQFLKTATRKWFNRLVKEYVFEERHLRILALAGQAWDRCTEIREILQIEGYQIEDRFGQNKAHPLLAEERSQAKLFSQLIRELGLDLEEPEIPRTPRIGGLYATQKSKTTRPAG